MHNPPMLSPRLACLAVVAAALWIVVSGCNGTADDRPRQWSFISATIIEPSCATVNCHSAITHQGRRRSLGARDRLPDAGQLRRQSSSTSTPATLQTSPVVTLMNAQGSIRMPPDNPLPQADIQLIEAWISHGAHEQLTSPRSRCTCEDSSSARSPRASCLLASAVRRPPTRSFSSRSGTTRCSQCHYDPAGGGLITSWGRDESGDTISLGGDGAFLHGLWEPPSWLALGADVRLAGADQRFGRSELPEFSFFPDAGRRLRAVRIRRSGLALPRRGHSRRRRPRPDLQRSDRLGDRPVDLRTSTI